MHTFRAPAYVGVGGLGGAVLSAFLQAATRPLAAPPLAAPSGLYPAAPGPQDSCSEPRGLAHHGLEGWPSSNLPFLSAGFGAFLLIFSFVLGVDRRRLQRVLPRLLVELREAFGKPALRVA